MRLFNLLKSIITAIKGISNRYYYTNKINVTGTYQTAFEVCRISNLPKGVYLCLGGVESSVANTSTIVSASIRPALNATNLMYQVVRTTMTSGGGASTYSLMEVTQDGGTIYIDAYRYYSGSVTYRGTLIAIKLI